MSAVKTQPVIFEIKLGIKQHDKKYRVNNNHWV